MKNKIKILITGLVICFCFVSLVNAEPPICGDGRCDFRWDITGENCESCPADCPCPPGFKCDPWDPYADIITGCVAPPVCEDCIEKFYIEKDHLSADGSKTKLCFKVLCPGRVKFKILQEGRVRNDVQKFGGFIFEGKGREEDMETCGFYQAPILEPTAELSGTMKLILRLRLVRPELEPVYKDIPVYIEIGEYVPPLPLPEVTLHYSNRPAYYECGIQEIIIKVLDEELKPITDEVHTIKFSIEPEQENIRFHNDGIANIFQGEAKIDLEILCLPSNEEDFEKINCFTLKAEDTTIGISQEWKIPFGPPITVLAEPNDPNDEENIDVAIIPGDSGYPARITATLGGNADYDTKAGRAVVFEIEPGYGELRGNGQTGLLVTALTDEYGRAEVFYHFIGTFNRQLITYTVTIRDDTGEEEHVTVKIGLGLRLNDIEAVLTSGSTIGIGSQFGLLVIITSDFHPGLVLEEYAHWAKDVWGGKEIGTYLDVKWINKPEPSLWEYLTGSTMINEVYSGHCRFDQKGPEEGGYDVLYALNLPSVPIGDISFPGMWIKSNGNHWFKTTVQLINLDTGSELGETPLMPFRFFEAIVDDPNNWLVDITCAMSPQTKGQFLFSEICKLAHPGIGTTADILDVACKIAQEQYVDALLAAGKFLGTETLETALPKWGPDKIPEETFDLYTKAMNTKEVAGWTDKVINIFKLPWSGDESQQIQSVKTYGVFSNGYINQRRNNIDFSFSDRELQDLSSAFAIGILTSLDIYTDEQIIIVGNAVSAELSNENGIPAILLDDNYSEVGTVMGARKGNVFSFIAPQKGIYTLKFETSEGSFISICTDEMTYVFYNIPTSKTTRGRVTIHEGVGGILELDVGNDGSMDREIEPEEATIITSERKTIHVDDDFTDDPANHKWNTIQEGITDATDSDTVLVYPGTYNETVVLNKTLTLIGEGLPTIDASGTGNAITITADDCTVKGFCCVNAHPSPYAGIRVESNNNVIEDNTCKNNGFGIILLTSTENIIAHNTAKNNDKNGIYLQDSNNNRITDNDASKNLNYQGISLKSSNNNEIRDNSANYNHYHGIRLGTSNENIIANNAAENNGACGIALWTSDANIVANNMAKNNGEIGILLSASQNNEIANNTANSNNFNGIRIHSHSNKNILTNNIANSNNEAGILCGTSSGNILTYNDLNSNKYGFWLYNYSTDNILANNTATSNSYGISVAHSSNNNIYLNNFVDNTDNAYSYNSNNIWHSTSRITYTYNSNTYINYLGNYWSDYKGSDADGDGIGDTPYIIDGDKDNYPLMKRFEKLIQ